MLRGSARKPGDAGESVGFDPHMPLLRQSSSAASIKTEADRAKSEKSMEVHERADRSEGKPEDGRAKRPPLPPVHNKRGSTATPIPVSVHTPITVPSPAPSSLDGLPPTHPDVPKFARSHSTRSAASLDSITDAQYASLDFCVQSLAF
jgi:hypothetical protein